jgi:antitoxin ParD1/3/4
MSNGLPRPWLVDRAEIEKLHGLQDAWREGIDSGDAGEIDFAELKQEARWRLAGRRMGFACA